MEQVQPPHSPAREYFQCSHPTLPYQLGISLVCCCAPLSFVSPRPSALLSPEWHGMCAQRNRCTIACDVMRVPTQPFAHPQTHTHEVFFMYTLVLVVSVLSCPVLSCPVLPCPVLSCPVLSCHVLFFFFFYSFLFLFSPCLFCCSFPVFCFLRFFFTGCTTRPLTRRARRCRLSRSSEYVSAYLLKAS